MKNLKVIFALSVIYLFVSHQILAQHLPLDSAELAKYKAIQLPGPNKISNDSEWNEPLYLISKTKSSSQADSILVESIKANLTDHIFFSKGFKPDKITEEGSPDKNKDSLQQSSTYIFSNLQPADRINGFPNYPFSTIVKLYLAVEDEFGNVSPTICSGVLVGPRHVITAGHCVVDPIKNTELQFGPGSLVIPAYNLGNIPYSYAYITEWVSFNGWINYGSYDYDIALLILDWDIGNSTGSLGFGYNPDPNWFLNPNNIHSSIGYPSSDDFGNTVFEGGERMYAMQGYLDWFESPNSTCHNNQGFHGQSGSGLYYKDNRDDRYVLGVLSHGDGKNFPFHTCHTKLDEDIFSAFMDKINQTTVSIDPGIKNQSIEMYPNPTYGIVNINFPDNFYPSKVEVFDLQGKLIKEQIQHTPVDQIQLDLYDLTNGTYLINIIAPHKGAAFKIIKQ